MHCARRLRRFSRGSWSAKTSSVGQRLLTHSLQTQTCKLIPYVLHLCGVYCASLQCCCRFIMTVPSVVSPVIDLHVCHPPPLWQHRRRKMEVVLREQLTQPCELLHPVATRRSFQFPETRLIQYDCGEQLRRVSTGMMADGVLVLIVCLYILYNKTV